MTQTKNTIDSADFFNHCAFLPEYDSMTDMTLPLESEPMTELAVMTSEPLPQNLPSEASVPSAAC